MKAAGIAKPQARMERQVNESLSGALRLFDP
jgi:hypothetical protein